MKTAVIDESWQAERIDKWISSLSDQYSRTQWRRVFDEGGVLVNQKPVKQNYRLENGDVVEYKEPEVEEMLVEPVHMDLDIVYEDDDLLVINKPKGLVVHPGAGTKEPTLVSGLLYHCHQLSDINGEARPGIVHRIDKNTSGLLVVAKNNWTHRKLAEQLETRTLSRKYLALVYGNIEASKGTIDAPIGRDPKDRMKMAVTPENSKQAITEFTVRKHYGQEYTLVECHLKTGRTHQIRVHMKYIGHPIVGDPQYGYRKNALADTQLLHAYEITFVHPSTGKTMTFQAPLPKEFSDILALLDQRQGVVR